jgi:uncharacterized protein YraI
VSILRSTAICLLAFVVCVSVCDGAEKVTVTGARVNVRAVPDPNAEIVGQVAQGDVLMATGVRQGDWVEISPPAAVSVWVYGELIRENTVAAASVRVRSGPGIGYRPVGSLSKGAPVTVLASKGDWLQIAPPETCKVWISAKYLAGGSIAPPVTEKPAVTVAPSASDAVPTPRVRVKHTPPPPAEPTPPMPAAKPLRKRLLTITPLPIVPVAPEADDEVPVVAGEKQDSDSQQRLVGRAPQGAVVSVSGVLRPAGFFPLRRPSPYRLVVSSGTGPAKTACYVTGDSAAISAHLGERVTLIGKRYWVQGVREPVVSVSEFRD